MTAGNRAAFSRRSACPARPRRAPMAPVAGRGGAPGGAGTPLDLAPTQARSGGRGGMPVGRRCADAAGERSAGAGSPAQQHGQNLFDAPVRRRCDASRGVAAAVPGVLSGSSRQPARRSPMTANAQILFDNRPSDKVSPANFRKVETPMPKPGDGEVLVKHKFLSLDPYMRGRLSTAKSYASAAGIGLGDAGAARSACRGVQQSRGSSPATRSSAWAAGSLIRSATARICDVVDAKTIPIQAYIGAARHARRHRLVRAQQDHRAEGRRDGASSPPPPARSARSSASLRASRRRPCRRHRRRAGEMRLCRRRSSATTPASTTNRRVSPTDLKAALPNGLDGLFENVGGEPFQQCLKRTSTILPASRSAGSSPLTRAPPTALPDMRHLPRPPVQGRGLHRLRPSGAVAAGDRRIGRPRRRRQAQMARDDPRRAWTARRRRWSTCCTATISAKCS